MRLIHEISVYCKVEDAYEFCCKADDWPNHLPPCLIAEVIEKSDVIQHIHLTSWGKSNLFTWKSERNLDKKHFEVLFQQKKTIPLVSYMTGKWLFKRISKHHCHIELWHEFDVGYNVQGQVSGVNTREEAIKYVADMVNINSHKELQSLKMVLERRYWEDEFDIAVNLNHNAELVYQLLKKYIYWPELLAHCKQIDEEYDDGEHQIYTMTVQVSEKDEVIRTIRHCSDMRIDYFQPSPPNALKAHKGRWVLKPFPGGVKVISWHKVFLNRDFWDELGIDVETAKQRIKQNINTNSHSTIMSINSKLATLEFT